MVNYRTTKDQRLKEDEETVHSEAKEAFQVQKPIEAERGDGPSGEAGPLDHPPGQEPGEGDLQDTGGKPGGFQGFQGEGGSYDAAEQLAGDCANK